MPKVNLRVHLTLLEEGEFEGAFNSIGRRQNELIKFNAKMLEWFTNKLVGDKTVG